MKTESQTQAGAAEAARYALMRRLVPVLRHHLVVDLQPIGLIYQVLDRKLNAGETGLTPIRESLGRIDVLARKAVASSLDVVSWLAPDTEASTPLGSGVVDCLNMLRSNFTFRGFTVHNEVGDAPLRVPQGALREVLTGALIAATDGASGSVELTLRAHLSGIQAMVSIHTVPGTGEGIPNDMAYRALEWSDVQALAQAHAVHLVLDGEFVSLTLPARAPAAAADAQAGAAAVQGGALAP